MGGDQQWIGELYFRYQLAVPMFFPRRGQWRKLLRFGQPAEITP